MNLCSEPQPLKTLLIFDFEMTESKLIVAARLTICNGGGWAIAYLPIPLEPPSALGNGQYFCRVR